MSSAAPSGAGSAPVTDAAPASAADSAAAPQDGGRDPRTQVLPAQQGAPEAAPAGAPSAGAPSAPGAGSPAAGTGAGAGTPAADAGYAAPQPSSPLQAPPPVGPPSPYGPPPAAVAATHAAAQGAGAQPAPVQPAPAPYPGAQPGPYPAPQPGANGTAPQPPYETTQPYGSAQPYGAPGPYDAPRTAVFAAEQPPPGAPHHPAEGGAAPNPNPDPFAVPAVPAYASGGVPPYGTPQTQPGHGGPGAPGGPVWGSQQPPEGGRRRRGVGGLVAAVIVAALVAGGVGGGVGYEVAHHNSNDTGSTTISAPADTKAFNRAPTSVAGIAKAALPSVVTIKASGSRESGTGTGFVFDKQGHILTNNHVVAPAANGGKLTVTFSNGDTYDASVVGRASGYDVAVVKLKNPSGATLNPLPLGNSDDAAVGDATIAIGAPYGLSGTVTTGIVSAVHRPVASSDEQGSSASYMSAIQTDASINPGNSGGPLLNANGAVIGINSAIQPGGTSAPGQQGGSVGLGFAIPINQAKRVADQLIKTGTAVYPVIGVTLNTAYQGDGAQIGSGSSSVTSGGPGDKAGLRGGDVITKFDGDLIDSGQTLIGEIWQHQPGDKVSVTYTRDGSSHTTTVTLGSRTGDSN